GQRQGQMLLPATAIALEEIGKFQRVARQRYGSISKRLDRIARNLLDALVHLLGIVAIPVLPDAGGEAKTPLIRQAATPNLEQRRPILDRYPADERVC